ncbi:CheW domain-containing protein [Halopseudomonas pelagia]|uniref:Chemotaxis protein CheW n=1 Tax=Halopseudomonas pelagia TaxID=553151 RepID=A0AA91Z4C8_9GAMM|nr:CheW domain-containing protein [Halopseudomonas pelagia]PCC97440.1 chemotaxis protein CheW [Halopseudomonas pelagia]QFY57755.1 chemotaxis protein CheW [Halopseudomonas pelagia]
MTKPLPVQQFIPQQTIQSYLDALLQDAIEDLSLAEELEAQPVAEAVPYAEPPAVDISRAVIETTAVAVKEVEAEVEVEAENVLPLVEQPQWREQPFEALLFDVGGLTLAVPLILLGTIHPLDSEITPLFGQPDWFLGIMPTSAGNLKVLDTARWVMPERYTPALRDDLRFVISVQGHEWGLAVHDVSKSVKLTPEQIKWRSQEGKRPWLAGTVIEHMCALVDVSALAGLIAAGAKTQQGAKVERALA